MLQSKEGFVEDKQITTNLWPMDIDIHCWDYNIQINTVSACIAPPSSLNLHLSFFTTELLLAQMWATFTYTER